MLLQIRTLTHRKAFVTLLFTVFLIFNTLSSLAICQTTSTSVEIYIGEGCPHCDKAVALFGELNVPSVVYNVDRNVVAGKSLLKNFGHGILPLIHWDQDYFRGFDEQRIRQLAPMLKSPAASLHDEFTVTTNDLEVVQQDNLKQPTHSQNTVGGIGSNWLILPSSEPQSGFTNDWKPPSQRKFAPSENGGYARHETDFLRHHEWYELRIMMGGVLIFYFFPSILALFRRHPDRWLIICFNCFLGFTGFLWFYCLIWSLGWIKNGGNHVAVIVPSE